MATYRALAQLPRSHVPPDLLMPFIDLSDSSRSSPQLQAVSMLPRDQILTPPSSVGSKTTAIHNHLPSVMNQLTLPRSSSPSTSHLSPTPISLTHLSPHPNFATPVGKPISTPHTNNPTPRMRLPPLNVPVFQYAWLGLAGISSKADEDAFGKVVCGALRLDIERVKVSNGKLTKATSAIFLCRS